MMKKKWLNIIASTLIGTITITSLYTAKFITFANDTIETYTGRQEASTIINNIDFTDVNSKHWGKEAITRLGAMNVITGYNNGSQKNYSPNNTISKEESLVLILRILGKGEEAQQAALEIEKTSDYQDTALSLWSKGYLKIAAEMQLISSDDFLDAIKKNQKELNNTTDFIRTSPVTREQLTEWLVKAINQQNSELIAPIYDLQYVFSYTDWNSMTNNKIPYIEAVIKNRIMVGNNNSFYPKQSVTRAEIAQIIKNVDDILYQTMQLTLHTGIIEKIVDEQNNTLSKTINRTIYIRNNKGQIHTIKYEFNPTDYNLFKTKDVPVYKNGTVTHLKSLEKNDSIEYLTDDLTQELIYVQVTGEINQLKVKGNLNKIDLSTGKITITNSEGTPSNYILSDNLYYKETNQIIIGSDSISIDNAPIGSIIELTIKNSIVTNIAYDYNLFLYNEISGIVKEINTNFGYITIIDRYSGKEVTKNFFKDQVIVEKQSHYDEYDEIGYIDELFNIDTYDEKDASITSIEPGDIVYLKLDTNKSDTVTHISAKTNYIVKYGKIKNLNYQHDSNYNFILELEDGSIVNYNINESIPIKKAGKTVPSNQLLAGDWVKLLVNQVVLEPGHITDKIKEIDIDQYQNNIANIYKGTLGSYNQIQKSLTLLNTYTLTDLGWHTYQSSRRLETKNSMPEIYYNGNRISFNEAINQHQDKTAFIAMESYYDKEKICKIMLTNERDTLLDSDYVLSADGSQRFKLFKNTQSINTDSGTIVIRNGRLVDSSTILSPDYAQVVLDGSNKAAIVNITNEPGNAALTVSRGRIKEITDYTSVVMTSQSMLKDMTWIYSPIERTYIIDHDTYIVNENGYLSLDKFIDYGESSQFDQVYTIISEGTKAKYLIGHPYSTEGFRGTVYKTTDDSIEIKDVTVYNTSTNKWTTLSKTKNYAKALLATNSIILKNNKKININDLKLGDTIKVLTNINLSDKLKLNNSNEAKGYIILVE